MALALVNTANVDDASNPSYRLDGARAVTTAVVGGTTYLFVSGAGDSGLTVFAVAADGTLTYADDVADSDNPATFKMSGAFSVTTAVAGGATYVYVGGLFDDGFSGFLVGANGLLSNVDNEADNASAFLDAILSLTTLTVAGTTRLYAAGSGDDGVSMYSISPAGAANLVDGIGDGGSRQLSGASALATMAVAGKSYLFASGQTDNGFSVFELDASGGFGANVDNVTNGGARQLGSVNSLATASVGGRSYVYAAGSGISGFRVDAGGVLTNIVNVSDDATTFLLQPRGLATAVIGGTTYLFVGSIINDAVTAFAIAADGSLVKMATVVDAGPLELGAVGGLSTAVIGGSTYLFVTGQVDSGVSVFRLDASGLTITGTVGNDLVSSTNAPAGQLLPGDFGDTIRGLSGNDNLFGLLGDDAIYGGSGNDKLIGGIGKDLLKGGHGRDTFDFNLASESQAGHADRIQAFSHAQGDRIDLRTIDATPGGPNNAFQFIGDQTLASYNANHSGGVVRTIAGKVEVDIGGNNTVDMIIKTPGATLVDSDFLL